MPHFAITTDLSSDQRRAAEAMTFPAYRAYLSAGPENIAFAAVSGNRLLGLALVRLGLDSGNAARLLSLFVDKDHRRIGVGQALLLAACRHLEPKVNELSVFWSSNLPSAEAFEALLIKAGWANKTLDQCRVSRGFGMDRHDGSLVGSSAA